MPIKNLTDTHQFGAGLPRLGTLYKGDEKGENRPGKDLKHFRFEPEPQFAYLQPVWNDLYSGEPTEFSPVFLFGNTADEAFETWMEEWSATGLQHRCDGETQTRWYDKSIGEYSTARIACAAPQCQCKRTGRLRLVFPDFVEAAGVMGYVAMTTHSIHDILTLHRYLSDIARMYGKLEGVPFVFGRAAREVSAPKPLEPGKRIKTTKSLLYMHVLPDFTREQLVSRIAPAEAPQLASGTVDEETGEIIRVAKKAPSVRKISGGEDDGLPDWWNDLLDWADDKFDFDEGLTRMALKLTDGRWKAEKRVAMAAVIAAHCKYDKACIDAFTSENKYAFETYAAALEVVATYQSRMQPEGVAE